MLDALNVVEPLTVADAFGGVATTALALRDDPRVREVQSVEWSPLAVWVGNTKLAATSLDVGGLERQINRALEYAVGEGVAAPTLSAFSNADIFEPTRLQELLAAREHIRHLDDISDAERAFLLLGLCAVVEDASGAMKDGRALRILRGRSRNPSSLATRSECAEGFRSLLKAQLRAMLTDVRGLASDPGRPSATSSHIRGDARNLGEVKLATGGAAFPKGKIDAFIYSPPYLNAIDYSEVYKLELWFMEFLRSQTEFRALREGTLRSHPSIRFDERGGFDGVSGEAVELVGLIASWVTTWSTRPENGPIVRQYFEDMFEAFVAQAHALGPNGVSVCVVANSTYAHRARLENGSYVEEWRIPLLTDVILAHLGRIAGFPHTEIWHARHLRPRNVRGGSARESLVVLRKMSS